MSNVALDEMRVDSRLRQLSPSARDLLERILGAFPHETLFGSGVPAAPAQLRLTLYHSDDPRLDSQIGRQLKELELNSIGILRRVSRKTRYLTLTLDFCSAPGPMQQQREAVVSSVPKYDTSVNAPLIHKARDSLDSTASKIIAVAAASTDSSSLIRALTEHFPWHDVAAEFERYFAHRKKIGRPATGSPFAKWMLRAEVPLKKPAKTLKRLSVEALKRSECAATFPSASTIAEQPDLFDELAARNFRAEFQARKARRTTKERQ